MTKFNKNRQSIRLKKYDYSQQGLYFITICTHKMDCFFGHVLQDIMYPNSAGKMIEAQWLELKKRFHNISLHDYVVMPNHFHSIIEVIETDKTLADMIGAFKSLTTNEYIKNVKENNWLPFNQKLWKRNYYEHVIRSEESYLEISKYIKYNPSKWCDDKFYVS